MPVFIFDIMFDVFKAILFYWGIYFLWKKKDCSSMQHDHVEVLLQSICLVIYFHLLVNCITAGYELQGEAVLAGCFSELISWIVPKVCLKMEVRQWRWECFHCYSAGAGCNYSNNCFHCHTNKNKNKRCLLSLHGADSKLKWPIYLIPQKMQKKIKGKGVDVIEFCWTFTQFWLSKLLTKKLSNICLTWYQQC